ncbi:hypothetical protein ABZ470_23725 [Streptosporangium sp. NPDC020072]|uniref:hypothetical protein n=1 Tax=Streptosporangium sp. NPDC020072 TaxID=3154788 RepID=UPI00344545AF
MTHPHQGIFDKVRNLRTSATERDAADRRIYDVRNGRIEDVFPGMFSEDFPKPIIANFVDIAARSVAESLAPLPAFNASATNMVSDQARSRADKKTKGMWHYIERSNLQTQMYSGADYYASYGRMPILVEPDFASRVPRFLILDPRNSYPEVDRWGKCRSYSRVFRKTIAELCAEYPEHAQRIAGPYEKPYSQSMVEAVLYMDDSCTMLYLPDRKDCVLAYAENSLGECPVRIARRPGLVEGRGQYDDILWTQVARNRFANLAMAAAEAATEAPLAVPYDVQEVALGPLALIRSSTPEKIRRVGTELPQAAFAESQLLEQELRIGARFPESRSGNVDASIITGQGVRALEGGFDSQIRAAQDVFVDTLGQAMELALRMDEHYWPDVERSIRGQQDGVPYEIKWKPSRDIAGDYSCDVSYGFSVGLDPNRSLVFILQLLGAQLISKDLARRQFPFGINTTQEEQRIEIEGLREALLASVSGYAQSIPMLAQSGMDPSEAVNRMAAIVKGRQKGKALEDVIASAFAPPKPPPGEVPTGSEQLPLAPGGMAAPGGPQMPAGMPPGGGGFDVLSMLAGLNSGGSPTTNVNVKREIPI